MASHLCKLISSTLVIFLFCQTGFAELRCDKEIVHGWGGVWEPYIMGTPNNPSGVGMDILAAMVSRAGCSLRHTDDTLPWARSLQMIRNGEIDIIGGASKTKKRENYAYFIGQVREEYVGIFIRQGEAHRFKIEKLEDLLELNFSIGTTLGYAYGERIDAILRKIGSRNQAIREADDGNTNMLNRKKLLAGRIDGYIGYPTDEFIALERLKLLDHIETHPMPHVSTGKIYFMLSKKRNTKQVAAALQQSLEKDGTYDAILQKYQRALYNPLH